MKIAGTNSPSVDDFRVSFFVVLQVLKMMETNGMLETSAADLVRTGDLSHACRVPVRGPDCNCDIPRKDWAARVTLEAWTATHRTLLKLSDGPAVICRHCGKVDTEGKHDPTRM